MAESLGKGTFLSMGKSKTSAFGTVTREGHDARPFYQRSIYDHQSHKTHKAPLLYQPPQERNVMYCQDSQHMHQLPDSSVHLMITSPPYNVGKEYDENLSLVEYQNLLKNVLAETYRVLVDGGRACVNIANIGRTPYIPLHKYVIDIADACGFLMRGEVIWDKGASAGASCAWGSWQSASNPVLRDVHEYILIFSKGRFERKPIGENSLSKEDFLENTKSIWRFPTTSAKKRNHPAPFPIELPLRLIHLYSYINDVVLDPFMGSGTTAEAALTLNRRYIGYETHEEYVKFANLHIQKMPV